MRNRVDTGRRGRALHARGNAFLRPALLAAALALALPLALPLEAAETSILVSPAAMPGAEVAYAVGLDGTSIVLGAPGEDTETGAAYVIECATQPCAEPLRIVPADLNADDAFGTAVGISGDTLVATAPGPEPGAAYIYVRDAGGWSQQAKLTPSGGSSGERFGVSASVFGDLVAIGADRADDSGAVYVFLRSGTEWIQEARVVAPSSGPRVAFGASVSLESSTLIVGAPFKRNAAAGSYANGAAYVFIRQIGGWALASTLVPSSSANGDLFGFSVDIAGNRGIVGAPYADSARGTAFVFASDNGAWSEQAQLTAAAGAAGDEFGWSVAIDDDKAVVGAPFAGQLIEAACGASYVFDGPAFVESNAGAITQPVLNELTGWSVAASGGRWVASAPGHIVDTDVHAGAAYWFAASSIFTSGFDMQTLPSACVPKPDGD